MLSALFSKSTRLFSISWAAKLFLGFAIVAWLSGCQWLTLGKGDTVKETDASAVERPPCPTVSAPEHEKGALLLLGQGENDKAKWRLQCALQKAPDSDRAQLVLEQLEVDPVESLGSEYFWYTLQDNETLSILAERYLGSGYKFVVLARYNDIAVPDAVTAGQRIKIPGTPPAAPPPPPREGPSEEVDAAKLLEEAREARVQGDLEKAYALLSQAGSSAQSNEGIKQELAEVEAALIDKYSTEAYQAEVQGNKDRAILLWKKMLEIRPDYIEANVNLSRLAGSSEQ